MSFTNEVIIPGLAARLIEKGTLQPWQLVAVAGPALDNAEAVADHLGVMSHHKIEGLLTLWAATGATPAKGLWKWISGDRPRGCVPWGNLQGCYCIPEWP